MKFDDLRIDRATSESYFQMDFYDSNNQKDWIPIYEIERSFLYHYKMFQRIQFPLLPAEAKTIHKSQGITEDEVVVDLTQHKRRVMRYEGCSNMNASSFITFFKYMLRQNSISFWNELFVAFTAASNKKKHPLYFSKLQTFI